MSTHPQTWYNTYLPPISISNNISCILRLQTYLHLRSPKTDTKPIQPTQNSHTLYQHQPNLATPMTMTSTYTTFLNHSASTLISWLHHHHQRRFVRHHNMPRCWLDPSKIHPHTCQPDTETAYWWHSHHISHANTYSICTMSHNQLHQ